MPPPLYKTGDSDVKVSEKSVTNKVKLVWLEEYAEYIDDEKKTISAKLFETYKKCIKWGHILCILCEFGYATSC